MEKIIIIGCPGSGKSTFGRQLKSVMNIPLYHLDMMYWNKDKTTVDKTVFIERLQDAMKNTRWIIDGNYFSSMEMRLEKCDTVFFLDYPTDICIAGIEKRKGQTRSDIPWIENGDYDEEFVEFVKRYNYESRPKVLDLLNQYSSKNIIVFSSRKESEEYILSLKNFQ